MQTLIPNGSSLVSIIPATVKPVASSQQPAAKKEPKVAVKKAKKN